MPPQSPVDRAHGNRGTPRRSRIRHHAHHQCQRARVRDRTARRKSVPDARARHQTQVCRRRVRSCSGAPLPQAHLRRVAPSPHSHGDESRHRHEEEGPRRRHGSRRVGAAVQPMRTLRARQANSGTVPEAIGDRGPGGRGSDRDGSVGEGTGYGNQWREVLLHFH